MRGLRLRLQFIVLLALGALGYFSYLTYQARQASQTIQANILESFEIRSSALQLVNAGLPAPQATVERFQQLRKSTTAGPRRDAVLDVVNALSMSDASWVHKRAAVLAEVEEKTYTDLTQDLARQWHQVEKNAIAALASAVFGLLFLSWNVRRRILKPLESLSRRMMDFLVDRYSFQFSQPEANELGDLQRTFNSLAQRVINTMDELKNLDQAKSEFLNIASHELRTPLTSIKGSLSLLGSGHMGEIDPSSLKLIKIAEVETDRLIRLINDLLDLAKIEAGKLPLVCAWMPWDEIAAKTTEGLMGLAHRASVNIKVEPAPGLEVFMDRDRIQQVLTNLISNAIKFSPEGGWIMVSVGRNQQGALLVNVQDQGPGIAPEDMALIFQKFRQGSSPDNPLVKGTGLGLAIAKALVAEHGGDIGVESVVGQGSTFWFTLPKWRDDESSSDDPVDSRAA